MGPNLCLCDLHHAVGRRQPGYLRQQSESACHLPCAAPPPVASASCTQQDYFSYTLTEGVNGVVIPPGTNTNQTVYLIRHAEAHPTSSFEDGNFVGAGQWRALSLPNFLPNALRGQISPTVVYSIDPAQSFTLAADFSVSYVRPSLTVLPYAIANNLPYYLVASFYIGEATDPGVAKATSDFFFTGGTVSPIKPCCWRGSTNTFHR